MVGGKAPFGIPLRRFSLREKKFRVLHLFSGPSDIGADAESIRALVKAFARNQWLDIDVTDIDYVNCDCYDSENGRPAAEHCNLTVQ